MQKVGLFSALRRPQHSIDIDFIRVPHNNNKIYRPGKMRKYYQACLVIVAVFSLVSLIFYRHQYNKLHYVLEVFNYFGQADAKLPNCTENLSTSLVYLNEPIPSWQWISDDLYVYSSYNVPEKTVRSIAFGKEIPDDLKCHVFFQDESLPFSGSFSHSRIENTELNSSKHVGFYFNCKYTSEQQKPVAVKYFTMESEHQDVPVMSIRTPPENLDSDQSAICVAPPFDKPITQIDMASFLSLYELLGFQHFVVYDHGIPASFNLELKKPMQWKFSYETMPWNFPFPGTDVDTMKSVIEADCLLRTMNRVAFAMTLSWQEYIVLKFYEDFNTITKFISTLKERKIVASRYSVKSLVFCTEQEDDANLSDAIIFRKKYSYPNIAQQLSVDLFKPNEVFWAQDSEKKNVSSRLIMVNRYQRCNGASSEDLQSKTLDNSIQAFSSNMHNSVVYRRFAARNLQSSKLVSALRP